MTAEDPSSVSALEHDAFPELDVALRRGRHIDRDEAALYAFLSEHQAELERFYRRFGAELVFRNDGFFFLLPTGDRLSRRQLSPAEMLVGQGLTLLYLDPATVQQGGVTTREQLLSQLSAVMGTDPLIAAFNPKRRRQDERVAQETVRTRVAEAIRRLAALGFVELLPDDQLRLRAALMRFAEPVRGAGSEAEALARLVASGEITLGDATPEESDPELAEGGEEAPAEDALDSVAAAWQENEPDWGAEFAAPDAPPEEAPYDGAGAPVEEAPYDGGPGAPVEEAQRELLDEASESPDEESP